MKEERNIVVHKDCCLYVGTAVRSMCCPYCWHPEDGAHAQRC